MNHCERRATGIACCRDILKYQGGSISPATIASRLPCRRLGASDTPIDRDVAASGRRFIDYRYSKRGWSERNGHGIVNRRGARARSVFGSGRPERSGGADLMLIRTMLLIAFAAVLGEAIVFGSAALARMSLHAREAAAIRSAFSDAIREAQNAAITGVIPAPVATCAYANKGGCAIRRTHHDFHSHAGSRCNAGWLRKRPLCCIRTDQFTRR